MKCLLVTIISYVMLNTSIQAQNSIHTEDQKEKREAEGSVRVDKTTSVAQQRIAYVKTKSIEQKAALKNAVQKGEIVVAKAKEKISLAEKKLEDDRAKNNISKQTYIARKARLEMIEKKIQNLENNLLKN